MGPRGAQPLKPTALPPAPRCPRLAQQGSCPPPPSGWPIASGTASLLNLLPQRHIRQPCLNPVEVAVLGTCLHTPQPLALQVQMRYLVDGTQKELGQNRGPGLGPQPHCATLGKPPALSEPCFLIWEMGGANNSTHRWHCCGNRSRDAGQLEGRDGEVSVDSCCRRTPGHCRAGTGLHKAHLV